MDIESELETTTERRDAEVKGHLRGHPSIYPCFSFWSLEEPAHNIFSIKPSSDKSHLLKLLTCVSPITAGLWEQYNGVRQSQE